jgi:4-(2-carboxyphenyl)-2-oxobut-3-enoate aldolase
LNTRDTIDRARALRAIGVDGLLLGRPMWSFLDDTDVVRYYATVADAVPELTIIVYDNPEAFKGKISTAAYAQLARIPQLIAAKYAGAGPALGADLEAVAGGMRLLPVDRDWYAAWTSAPDQILACWSGSASCGPLGHVELARCIAAGDRDGAAHLDAELAAASAGFLPEGNFALFSRYNVQMEKTRINAAGYINAGPSRPPYLNLPEAYAEGARDSGRRFAALHARYRNQVGAGR